MKPKHIPWILLAVAFLVGTSLLAFAGKSISESDLPPKVAGLVDKFADGNPISEIEKFVEEDVTVYEVEYKKGDREYGIMCTEFGDMIRIEKEISVSELPETVLAEIEEDFPGAQIKEVDAIQLYLYEIELEANGRKYELLFTAVDDIDDDDDEEHEGIDDDDDDEDDD